MEEERAQAKAVADDLYEYFREHMRGHMRDASRDGSRENLPATTLVEQLAIQTTSTKKTQIHKVEGRLVFVNRPGGRCRRLGHC